MAPHDSFAPTRPYYGCQHPYIRFATGLGGFIKRQTATNAASKDRELREIKWKVNASKNLRLMPIAFQISSCDISRNQQSQTAISKSKPRKVVASEVNETTSSFSLFGLFNVSWRLVTVSPCSISSGSGLPPLYKHAWPVHVTSTDRFVLRWFTVATVG